MLSLRSYGFLITEKLIFGFQILDLKVHFSASKVQCLKVFCYHGNKFTILLFIQFLEQLLKYLVNFTLLKYVKSQRSYGFLITEELIFGFQILDLKDHFSASLIGALTDTGISNWCVDRYNSSNAISF